MKKTENSILLPSIAILALLVITGWGSPVFLDLHLSDTYYVIGNIYLYILLYLLVLFALYKIIRFKDKSIPTWIPVIHFLPALLIFILVIIQPSVFSLNRSVGWGFTLYNKLAMLFLLISCALLLHLTGWFIIKLFGQPRQ